MAGSSPDPDPGQDDDAAYRLLEQLRWGDAAVPCPHCGVVGRSYFLRPADGSGRRTRTGAPTARRVWKCGSCRRQFSVLTGTVLEATRVPVSSWVRAVGELVSHDGQHGDRSTDARRLRAVTGLGAEAVRHLLARWTAAAECEPLRTELTRSRR